MSEEISEITATIDGSEWQLLVPDADLRAQMAVRTTLAKFWPDLHDAGVAVVLTNDRAIQLLNRDWRQADKPTNVLAFPATDTKPGARPVPEFRGGPLELGDIVVALETCVREAEDRHIPPADHLTHLVVHGTLHLLGYDHGEDDQAETMESLETEILSRLEVPDPYG
jgi:probable rRNA maturation factor